MDNHHSPGNIFAIIYGNYFYHFRNILTISLCQEIKEVKRPEGPQAKSWTTFKKLRRCVKSGTSQKYTLKVEV